MEIKSVAQYHKLHKVLPKMSGSFARENVLKNISQKIKEGDKLIRYRGKVKINTKGN